MWQRILCSLQNLVVGFFYPRALNLSSFWCYNLNIHVELQKAIGFTITWTTWPIQMYCSHEKFPSAPCTVHCWRDCILSRHNSKQNEVPTHALPTSGYILHVAYCCWPLQLRLSLYDPLSSREFILTRLLQFCWTQLTNEVNFRNA